MAISVHTNESAQVLPRDLAGMHAVQSQLDAGFRAKQIESHSAFVGRLADTLEARGGDLVAADLDMEGVRLQALQVQQQLGAQQLSIANQAPRVILELFRD